MAEPYKTASGKWRIGVYRHGVRDSQSFDTTRTEQKHGDLSIADIEKPQQNKGSCHAATEIDKRTRKGAKVSLF